MAERDVALSTRLNSVALATARRYYRTNGVEIRSKSDLVARITKDFARVLVHNRMVSPPDDVVQAQADLSDLGITSTYIESLEFPPTAQPEPPTVPSGEPLSIEARKRAIFNSLLEDD